MYRERHAQECDTNGRSLMSHLIDDQPGLVFGSLTIPEGGRERMARLAASSNEVVDVPKLMERRRRIMRIFEDGGYTDAQYQAKLAEIEAGIRVAQPSITSPSLPVSWSTRPRR